MLQRLRKVENQRRNLPHRRWFHEKIRIQKETDIMESHFWLLGLWSEWTKPSDQSIPHQQMPARLNGFNDLSNHYTALLIVSSRYLCHQYLCRYWSIHRRGAWSDAHWQSKASATSVRLLRRFDDFVWCKIMKIHKSMGNKQKVWFDIWIMLCKAWVSAFQIKILDYLIIENFCF